MKFIVFNSSTDIFNIFDEFFDTMILKWLHNTTDVNI